MIHYEIYNEKKHKLALENYALSDITHADSPQNIVSKSMVDPERYAIAIFENTQFVGFFCLHVGKGPGKYGYSEADYGLIRGFSVDERYRGQGIASRAFNDFQKFMIDELNLPNKRLILAVNEKNIPAQKAYEHSDFVKKAGFVKGKLGNLIIMEKEQT